MIFVEPVFAQCPVCIVTVGGGLWLAKTLGVDELIASIWIGALTTAFAIMLADKWKLVKLPKPQISWSVIFYLLTLLYLQISGFFNRPYCKVWRVCEVWLGITVGTVFLWLGVLLDRFLRTKNGGKVFFPYQKVAAPVAMTLLASLIFYLLTC